MIGLGRVRPRILVASITSASSNRSVRTTRDPASRSAMSAGAHKLDERQAFGLRRRRRMLVLHENGCSIHYFTVIHSTLFLTLGAFDCYRPLPSLPSFDQSESDPDIDFFRSNQSSSNEPNSVKTLKRLFVNVEKVSCGLWARRKKVSICSVLSIRCKKSTWRCL
jgi:hypothetical protein